MDKELVRYFIEECKRDKEWAKRYSLNYIEFDNYFKYSGVVEKEVPLYEFKSEKNWKFGVARNDILNDHMQKIQIYKIKKNEKNNKKTTEEIYNPTQIRIP